MNCAHCRKDLSSYFEITRYTAGGTARGSVKVCGLICCIQWAYNQSVMRGAAAVISTKNALTNIIEAFRGAGGKK